MTTDDAGLATLNDRTQMAMRNPRNSAHYHIGAPPAVSPAVRNKYAMKPAHRWRCGHKRVPDTHSPQSRCEHYVQVFVGPLNQGNSVDGGRKAMTWR